MVSLKKIVATTALLVILVPQLAGAAESDPTSAYRQVVPAPVISIAVPTVVEVPLPTLASERFDALVYDKTMDQFIGSYVRKAVDTEVVKMEVTTKPAIGNRAALSDGSTHTSARFEVSNELVSVAELTLSLARPVQASSIVIDLDQHVSLPISATVEVETVDGLVTALAQTRMNSEVLTFPEVTGSVWHVRLEYVQPLAISEVRIKAADLQSNVDRSVRFLMQPNHEYLLYVDPDRRVSVPMAESGELTNNEGVRIIAPGNFIENDGYVPSDIDQDGIRDLLDNCVERANPDQDDVDGNGRGDVCDDFDRDGVNNDDDNCPDEPNRRQLDTDGDGIGDVCDGEESRLTERYWFVPWIGMGLAAGVLIVLFALVAKGPERKVE